MRGLPGFDSNEALTWPYNQYDQPSQRPNPANDPPLVRYIAHEVEAAVLYNRFTMENPFTGEIWSMAPIIQSPSLPPWNNDYIDVFDWMFSQRKPGAPDAPGGLRARAGDGMVILRWNAPANDGGHPVTGYKVWYGDETPVTVDASTHEYTFTGLANGQAYTFKVVAINEKGGSAAASVRATPQKGSEPVVVTPGGDSGGGAVENGGTEPDAADTEQDAESPESSYTLNTPADQPAVTDADGNTILPGGGEVVTRNGTRIHLPAGSAIDAGGTIVIGSGGATVNFESGLSLNIREGAEIALNDETAAGFDIVSSHPFHDVDEDAWFHGYVNAAYTFGLFNGTSSETFSPGTPMTRAMFVQVLANLENVDRSRYTGARFRDVPGGKWYTAAVGWAAENGIVHGVGADRFNPDALLTREQMITILYNYLKFKGYAVPQSLAQFFADDAIFGSDGTVTRAEAAAVFVKIIEYLASAKG